MFIAESQKSIYKLVHFAVISLNDFVSWNFSVCVFSAIQLFVMSLHKCVRPKFVRPKRRKSY